MSARKMESLRLSRERLAQLWREDERREIDLGLGGSETFVPGDCMVIAKDELLSLLAEVERKRAVR